MNLPDQGLLRHLVLVVLLKLALITALWWAFVRDAHVTVDATTMARQVSAPMASKQQSTAGETHGQ
ncbi:cytochrome oxidase putative small subunit CydP [Thauera linaloolentis]|uniref:Uncharacterized protein n=1 Tax=Thauera linaloolentis (strain DSM 12138 / JCM 21573 / CCUG 41526 / CIP 105981 / IAM 15112 / NBRC 102519 / 47Lol) TaxID=1123367 RepID=N6Y705_THAL4|nr:cytochrome oxidase putative small subunit CydP [Thauera linaloolentis]ENO90026.1 hypothetical protein C666_03145 [Thauera linaloolentis 47Lol = DSM 12138]MCM8565309.1 hypothetical protein [Thauera linaloolentis]